MQNAFRARFPGRNPPVKSTILSNVRKYLNAGTSLNLNKGNSGRRRTTRSAENIAAVRALLQQNPTYRHQHFLESLIIGDEAAFSMNGEVNSHNVRQYAPKGHPPAFNFERNDFRAN